MLSSTETYKTLLTKAESADKAHLRDLMKDSQRCASFTAEHEGIYLDYSRQNLDVETFDTLIRLANEVGVPSKMEGMKNGSHINNTEDRAVGHAALRTPKGKTFMVDGKDVVGDVHAVLDKIEDFSNRVRSGQWKGASGKDLTTVLAIGIGGSFLGPEFVYEALKTDANASVAAKGRKCRFLANVDPVDVSRALEGLNPETTLCIVVSKTFTTAETMLNARTVKNWLESYRAANLTNVEPSAMIAQHMVAVSTAIPKAVAFGIAEDNIFGFWKYHRN